MLSFILFAAIVFAFSLVGGIFFIFAFRAILRAGEKQKAIWQNVAQKFGLIYTPATFSKSTKFVGTFQRVPLQISTFQRIYGGYDSSRRKTFIRVQAWFPSHHTPQMTIKRDTLLGKLLDSEVKIGDAELDRLLLINGPDSAAIHTLLNHPDVKSALLDTFRRASSQTNIKIEGNSILLITPNGFSEDAISLHISRCVLVAQAIANAAEELLAPEPAPAEVSTPEAAFDAW